MLVPYSHTWPLVFQDLRQALLPVFAGTPIEIMHIGSTSVPGLAAKPVIDLLLGAPTLAEIEARVADIVRLDYTYRPHYEAAIPQRRYFVKDIAGDLRIHLHGVEQGGRLWREHLRFRDLLRVDDARRSEYEALKRQLAIVHAGDKAAYTLEKGAYIRSLLSSMDD
jgi:GrpB-like predicted nucleotidyltransferase (UPF0157 family)